MVEHFGMEEQLMISSNYPDYPKHKAAHTQFIASFNELKNKIDPAGPGLNIIIMTNRIVVDWLNLHIRNVDKKIASYLREKSGEQ